MEKKAYTVEQITSLINNLLNSVDNKDNNLRKTCLDENNKNTFKRKDEKDVKKKDSIR